MSKCPNCGSVLTCGCQRRSLANGKAGCTKCIGKSITPTTNETSIDSPVVNNATLKKE